MPSSSGHSAKGLALNYDLYYESGYYDSRYPRPNGRVLGVLHRVLVEAGSGDIIDFGCGNGRYMVAMLKTTSRRVIGLDISPQSLQDLRRRLEAEGVSDRARVLHGDAQALDALKGEAPAALGMMMFGVLSHINDPAQRIDALRRLAALLDADRGHLVLSVPNRLRRFRSLQDDGHSITYSRTNQGKALSFFYHLYDPETLAADLEAAGLEVETIMAESVLPESWITKARVLGWLDAVLSAVIPARWGYGLLAVARLRGGTR